LRWAASTPARSRLRLGLLGLAARYPSPLPPSRVDRVLLIRPDHIGDVLLGASAVALLRASLPTARLTYLVGPWSAEAARHGPAVDEVRTLAYPGFTRRRKGHIFEPYGLLVRAAARLRSERFDLAVVCRDDHWWGALLALVARIPLRVGGQTPETVRLLSHTYAARPGEPAAERALGVARLALRAANTPAREVGNVSQFNLTPDARAMADTLWQQHALGDRVVAIQPSAGAPLKSWPIERWRQLVAALIEDDLQVVLIGSPDDWPILQALGTCVPRLCGQSLDVSAALFRRATLVVTVDSGAGHLAAAVGTPTVRIYGPAPASVFGPWPASSDQQVLTANGLACAPCGNLQAPPCGARETPACMLAVGVDDVVKAVRFQLGQS
jgi:ADP-heptose:LPS heptosyltransferase